MIDQPGDTRIWRHVETIFGSLASKCHVSIVSVSEFAHMTSQAA
jgi:hypothetical protein